MQSDLVLAAVGQAVLRRRLRRDGPAFAAAAALLDGADVAFVNLEGTIRGSHGGWPMKRPILHVGEPEVLDDLKDLGFNALALCNNHAFDLGPGGVLSTLEEADRRGFLRAGVGATQSDAARGAMRPLGKHRVALVAADAGPQADYVYALDDDGSAPARPGCNRLAVKITLRAPESDVAALRRMREGLGDGVRRGALDYPDGNAPDGTFEFYGLNIGAADGYQEHRAPVAADSERYLGAITDAAAGADFVVAYLHHHHWEADLQRASGWMRTLARQSIDAGANVFVSHGIPMLQGIEIHRRQPIFYSLGNFIFQTTRQRYYDQRARSWESVAARCRFDAAGRLEEMQLVPVLAGGKERPLLGDTPHDVPIVPPAAYGTEIMRRLAELSEPLGTHIEIADDGSGTVQGQDHGSRDTAHRA